MPAFSSLIILSTSSSYGYLQAPVGKRQSWEKGIILPFRSDLKIFSQAWILVITPISNLARTQHDRGDISQSSHPSQGQEAHKLWKHPTVSSLHPVAVRIALLCASSSWQKALKNSFIGIKTLRLVLQSTCSVDSEEHCACLTSGQAALARTESCLWYPNKDCAGAKGWK